MRRLSPSTRSALSRSTLGPLSALEKISRFGRIARRRSPYAGAIGPGLRGVARRATPAHRVTYIHIPRTPDMTDGRQARRVSRRDALHVTSEQRPTTQDGEYYPVPLYPERSPQRPGSCVDSAAPGSSPIHWIEYVGDR